MAAVLGSVKAVTTRDVTHLDHRRLRIALTMSHDKPRKSLAAADGCRRKANCHRGGHNFLLEVIEEDIALAETFSKGGGPAHLTRILLKSEVKILPRHLSFFLSEGILNLLLILVLGFR